MTIHLLIVSKTVRKFCSDFRNKSSGIFVLGVVFSSDKFLPLNLPFLTEVINFVVLSLSLKMYFYL